MKKFYFCATLFVASLTMNSCGTGTTQNTADLATTLIGAAIGNGANSGTTAGGLLTSVLSSDGTQNVLGTVLGSLLGSKTSKSSIIGTWTYASPKVVFESESILAKVGSSLASSKIESMLTSQLKKMGFTAGKTTLTLNEDGTCVLALSGKSLNGTYNYDPNSSKLTIQGALGMTSVTCTSTVSMSQLYMLFEADKLLSLATNVTSASSTTSSLSSLLNNYSGLKLGWAMTK